MSYLHCHTKGCGWSQDDFYSKRYNPFTKIWSDVKWLINPKHMKMDDSIVKDLIKYTKIPVYKIATERNQITVFSWNWLLLEIVKDIKVAVETKWWTYKKFKKDYDAGKALCPKCKQNNFDID